MVYKIKDILYYIILFSYVFSFYVIIPIAYLILPLLVVYVLVSKKALENFLAIVSKKHIFSFFLFCFILIFLSICFSLFHASYDFSYTSVLVNQFFYLLIGVFFVACFLNNFAKFNIFHSIIIIFVIQSIIQLIVFGIPQLQDIMFIFNKADDFASGGYKGVRGLALASGTGWNLSLCYGLSFIIAFYYLALKSTNFYSYIYIVLLFIGCFFAGRTGYLGLFLGGMLFLFISNIKQKTFFLTFLPTIIILIYYLSGMFPAIYYELEDKVFPFVFEFYYNYESSGRVETGSTNILMDMWDIDFDADKILFGYGFFTDPYSDTNSYFKKVDVGILRNIFYWGWVGYSFIIIYQLYLIYIIKVYAKNHLNHILPLMIFILLYLTIAEMKAMTLGFNKMSMSMLFLILLSFVAKDVKSKKLNET